MEAIKTVELSITSLRITHEDLWLKNWVEDHGDDVQFSPNYLALMGDVKPLKAWFEYRGLDWRLRLLTLLYVYKSVKANGQIEPIKVYKDLRINTGHKRTAALLALHKEKVQAIYVPDTYKL